MKKDVKPVRSTHIGGQAAIEGVMMRGKKMYALSVRGPGGEIETVKRDLKKSKYSWLFKLPILRGIAAFGSSVVVGTKIIYDSADMAGYSDLTEENPSKFDKFLEKTFGDKLYSYVMGFAVFVAVAFSVLLFFVLPSFISSVAIAPFIGEGNTWALGIFEGLLRFAIFLFYLMLVARSKDVKRIFGYHGAEHKTINCFEHGEELNVENVKRHTRLHKRCGTSFLLIVMVISMIVFFFVRVQDPWLRILSRVLLIPFIAGLSYEFIKLAGRSDSVVMKVLSYPGLMLQKITTIEPDDGQIEVAIEAMRNVLGEEGDADGCQL